MKLVVQCLLTSVCLMISVPGLAIEMPALARKHTCPDCHAIDRRVVGPAWMDVSKRYRDATEYEYKGKKYPLVDGLVMKVSKGGSGNWGAMPMPINDPSGAQQEDIRELVKFILSLVKQ